MSESRPATVRQATTPARFGRSRFLGRISALGFSLFILAVLVAGWRNREFQYFTAESGFGYLLGIIGGSAMLVLLLYPLRKRLRFMHLLGPVKYWFRTHMMLGIIGPTLILYHANFQLGSLNSNVALFCMLAVALSGLIGRYIYTKIHNGLYGQKLTLEQLHQQKSATEGQLASSFALLPGLHDHLHRYEAHALRPTGGLLLMLVKRLTLGLRSYWLFLTIKRQLYRALRKAAVKQGMTRKVVRQHYRNVRDYLQLYFATIQKISAFSFYEGIFSLWHVLHMPLFIMMVITGIVHVIAVHMY